MKRSILHKAFFNVCFSSLSILLINTTPLKAQFKLYGMTEYGGANSVGQVFWVDTAGNFKDLHDFTGNPDGRQPHGSFILAADGNLYGMTEYGGPTDSGTIIEYNLHSNTCSVLYSLSNTTGTLPQGSLIQASDGKLYGMTSGGGVNKLGTIFSYDLSTSTYTKLYDFANATGGSPFGSLLQAKNGLLYGMTSEGGPDFWGGIFSFNITTKVYDTLHNFGNGFDGEAPYGSLIQATNGLLYGLTSNGGNNYAGTVFSYNTTTSTYTMLYSFLTSLNDGISPYGDLFQASNGKLYGLTNTGGGSFSDGNIFSFDINKDSLTDIFNFSAPSSGQWPYASFIPGPDGKLFATVAEGGVNGDGTAISFDPSTNAVDVIYISTSVNMWEPQGNFVAIHTSAAGVDPVSTLENSIKVYPNPSKGQFTVDLNTPVTGTIEIYDITGQMIYQTPLQATKTEINIANQPAGMYFYRAITTTGSIIGDGKIVKE